MGADLDNEIFTEIGDFGRSQMVTLLLIAILNMSTGALYNMYIITGNTLDYRCKVPECEFGVNNRDFPYNQSWLNNAIPKINGEYDNCHRYAPQNWTSTELPGQCTADMFDSSREIPCSQYVYTTDEKNIQTEFNIHCSDTYKLAFIGSVGNIARFIFLPITGLLCDKYGRASSIIWSTELTFIFATIKSFSTNYTMFIVLEFLEAAGTTCVFTGIFVLFIEPFSAKYHAAITTIYATTYPLGGVLLGFIAMYVHDFRRIMQLFYIPGLFIFVYIWLIPESVRWLLATGRTDRAIKTLKQIAKTNRRELSVKTIDAIKMKYSADTQQSIGTVESLSMVLKSKKLCLRFLFCCIQWMACCFGYFGLNQSSILIPNTNHYVSFIISVAIELPCGLLAQPLLSRLKRRTLLGGTFILAAISIITTPFLPETYPSAVLFCFLVGKGAVTVSFTVTYLYTSEQWPTNIRNTIMNTCSMCGRIGSIVAPFVVLLNAHGSSVSALLFGTSAIIAAITILFSPETFSKKLPDTIEEAKHL